jgi:hypothetical protein
MIGTTNVRASLPSARAVTMKLWRQTNLWSKTERSAGGAKKKLADNLMNHLETRLRNLRGAPRCGAKTRAGAPCQRPALRGRGRCRLHGGLSPGAPRGAKNGNFKSGDWTAESVEERKWLRSLVRKFAGGGASE